MVCLLGAPGVRTPSAGDTHPSRGYHIRCAGEMTVAGCKSCTGHLRTTLECHNLRTHKGVSIGPTAPCRHGRRLRANACIYRGAQPGSKDHVPSRVFLDEPYPPGLPTVAACENCNAGFSLDEQYLACFLECVLCGSIDPAQLKRPKVKRVLLRSLCSGGESQNV
jgi:hypothetical protein